MSLERNEFKVLGALEKNQDIQYTYKTLAKLLELSSNKISLGPEISQV